MLFNCSRIAIGYAVMLWASCSSD